MAKAVSQLTPITWIVPLAARALLAKRCGGSESYAERLIFEGLVARKVCWRLAGIRPHDHPLDGFWQQLKSFDWSTGTAIAWALSAAAVGFDYATAYGVQFAQENIEALCPSAEPPPLSLVESETVPEDSPLSDDPVKDRMTQQEWWDACFPPGTPIKLNAEYKTITEASEAIRLLMEGDSRIEGGAYQVRYIEKLLRERRAFPKRRSPRLR